MGAALASHDLSDPRHVQLLSEYVHHSRKTAVECAKIFRGSLGTYDDEEQQDSTSLSSLNPRKPNYPRHIQLSQFEEVFGMLIADPEPHFLFFQNETASPATPKTNAPVTVCAHRVFCAVALLMKADLHAKIDFVLRLYADASGTLTPEAKSSLLKDFITTVDRLLQLEDPIPSDMLAIVEKPFWSDDPDQLVTVRELYDVCLTNLQISGMLHDVNTLIEGFSSPRRQDNLRQRESRARTLQISTRSGEGQGSLRVKSLARTMSSIVLPRGSLLWDLKAGDYIHFWQQSEPLEIRSDSTCAHALEKMAQMDATSALIVNWSAHDDTRQCLGLVTTDRFFLYFLHFLVPNLHSAADKPYEHSRARAEDAIRRFGSAPLRALVRFYSFERAPLLCCVRDDEAFFSVLMRFACGESAVTVTQDYRCTPEAVLGRLTVFDMLAWLEEDLTLLRGQERCTIASFPAFFYAPATIDVAFASASVCETLVEMAARKLSGILVKASAGDQEKILSANAFRDLFPPTFAKLTADEDAPGPLLCALTASAATLPPVCVVTPDTSIARVIREMVAKRTRRVIIRRQDGLTVGAVRATDVLSLVLRAQYTSHRPKRV